MKNFFKILFISLFFTFNCYAANYSGHIVILSGGTTLEIPVKRGIITASSSGDTTLVSAVTGKKIRVLSYNYNTNGIVNVKFKGSSTDVSGTGYWIANTGKALAHNEHGWFETASGEPLKINLSASVAVGGEFTYVEIP